MRKRIFGITSTVFLLGVASFFNDIGSETIKAILPMFITSLGGAGIAIGLIGGIRDSFDSLLRLFFGYRSDKTGKRKPYIWIGYLTSTLGKIALAFSAFWYQILIFVGLDRAGKGIREAPRDALIAESMPHNRGKAFSIHKTLDNLGAIAGAILAFVLLYSLKLSFKKIIFIAGCVGILSLIPLKFLGRLKSKPRSLRLSFGKLDKRLKLFIIVAAVFALGNFSYMFFILKVINLAPQGPWRYALPIALYLLFTIVYVSLLIPFGKLADKIGKKKVVILGYGLFALVCAGFALLNSLVLAIIFLILYGIFIAMTKSNQLALISEFGGNLEGTSLGSFQMIIGLLAIPASLIAGVLWTVAPSITFYAGSGFSVCAVGLMLGFWKKINR